MMKKMKRLVAVLLAGVMALTMLTACGGGGSNDSIDRSTRIEEALTDVIGTAGTPFDNADVNAIIEATSQKISEKPSEYYESALAYKNNKFDPAGVLYFNLLSELGKNCETALNKSLENNLAVALLFLDGSMTEDKVIASFNTQETALSTYSSETNYCARVYHIANPANADDNLWAIFMIIHQ